MCVIGGLVNDIHKTPWQWRQVPCWIHYLELVTHVMGAKPTGFTRSTPAACSRNLQMNILCIAKTTLLFPLVRCYVVLAREIPIMLDIGALSNDLHRNAWEECQMPHGIHYLEPVTSLLGATPTRFTRSTPAASSRNLQMNILWLA